LGKNAFKKNINTLKSKNNGKVVETKILKAGKAKEENLIKLLAKPKENNNFNALKEIEKLNTNQKIRNGVEFKLKKIGVKGSDFNNLMKRWNKNKNKNIFNNARKIVKKTSDAENEKIKRLRQNVEAYLKTNTNANRVKVFPPNPMFEKEITNIGANRNKVRVNPVFENVKPRLGASLISMTNRSSAESFINTRKRLPKDKKTAYKAQIRRAQTKAALNAIKKRADIENKSLSKNTKPKK
jgi:hypothetical protein